MKDLLQLTRVLLIMLLLCLLGIFLFSCRSHKESVQVQAEASQSEHVERVSVGQSIFALFDSLNATLSLEADSLELEIFALEIPSVENDSLALARPPRSEALCKPRAIELARNGRGAAKGIHASGRLAARLSMKGIRSNTQLTHTQTTSAESLSVDTVSTHRFGHQEFTEISDSEEVVKPPIHSVILHSLSWLLPSSSVSCSLQLAN